MVLLASSFVERHLKHLFLPFVLLPLFFFLSISLFCISVIYYFRTARWDFTNNSSFAFIERKTTWYGEPQSCSCLVSVIYYFGTVRMDFTNNSSFTLIERNRCHGGLQSCRTHRERFLDSTAFIISSIETQGLSSMVKFVASRFLDVHGLSPRIEKNV